MKRILQWCNPFTLVPVVFITFILAFQDGMQWLLTKLGYYDWYWKKHRR